MKKICIAILLGLSIFILCGCLDINNLNTDNMNNNSGTNDSNTQDNTNINDSNTQDNNDTNDNNIQPATSPILTIYVDAKFYKEIKLKVGDIISIWSYLNQDNYQINSCTYAGQQAILDINNIIVGVKDITVSAIKKINAPTFGIKSNNCQIIGLCMTDNAYEGQEVEIKYTIASGYKVGNIQVIKDSDKKEIELKDNKFIMPSSSVEILFSYTYQEYSIQIDYGQGGQVQCVSNAKYKDIIELDIKPNDGYELDSVTITDEERNSIEISNNSFIMPSSDININVTFKPKESVEEKDYYTIRIEDNHIQDIQELQVIKGGIREIKLVDAESIIDFEFYNLNGENITVSKAYNEEESKLTIVPTCDIVVKIIRR